MNPRNVFLHRSACALAGLCTALFACAMVALPLCKEQVFLEPNTLRSGWEVLILIGFLLVPFFDLMSLGWVVTGMVQARAVRKGDAAVLALGILCLLLLMAEKVMADEIGREYALGWRVSGEWIMLYTFLVIQLLYNLVILRRLFRVGNVRQTDCSV